MNGSRIDVAVCFKDGLSLMDIVQKLEESFGVEVFGDIGQGPALIIEQKAGDNGSDL